jgi:hypothetical protein
MNLYIILRCSQYRSTAVPELQNYSLQTEFKSPKCQCKQTSIRASCLLQPSDCHYRKPRTYPQDAILVAVLTAVKGFALLTFIPYASAHMHRNARKQNSHHQATEPCAKSSHQRPHKPVYLPTHFDTSARFPRCSNGSFRYQGCRPSWLYARERVVCCRFKMQLPHDCAFLEADFRPASRRFQLDMKSVDRSGSSHLVMWKL